MCYMQKLLCPTTNSPIGRVAGSDPLPRGQKHLEIECSSPGSETGYGWWGYQFCFFLPGYFGGARGYQLTRFVQYLIFFEETKDGRKI